MKRIDSSSTVPGPVRRLLVAACIAGAIAGGAPTGAEAAAPNGKARGAVTNDSAGSEVSATEAAAGKRSPFSGLARFFSSRRTSGAGEGGEGTETGPDPAGSDSPGDPRRARTAPRPGPPDPAPADDTGASQVESERAGRPRGLAALLGLRREENSSREPPPVAGATTEQAGDASRTDKYVVTETATPFYEDSPLQARGVDRRLAKGTIVSLVKMRKGWTDVVLETGNLGTVPTETLRKAKASDFPVPAFAIKEAETSPGVAGYYQAIADLPPVPLPSLPDDDSREDGAAASTLLDNPLLLLPPLDPESGGNMDNEAEGASESDSPSP